MNKIIRDEKGNAEITFDITFKQYIKKPVVMVVVLAALLDEPVEIETPEGTVVGDVGDYLVCDIGGEYHICKPDTFEKTYEPFNGVPRQRSLSR